METQPKSSEPPTPMETYADKKADRLKPIHLHISTSPSIQQITDTVFKHVPSTDYLQSAIPPAPGSLGPLFQATEVLP